MGKPNCCAGGAGAELNDIEAAEHSDVLSELMLINLCLYRLPQVGKSLIGDLH